MGQQAPGMSGVLGGHKVGFPEDAQRSQGDILEIADGCPHQKQSSAHHAIVGRPASKKQEASLATGLPEQNQRETLFAFAKTDNAQQAEADQNTSRRLRNYLHGY